MGEETAIFRKAREHKKTIAGGLGGASIVGLAAVVLPFFTEERDANARQWQKIAALESRVIILETKLEFYLKTGEKPK